MRAFHTTTRIALLTGIAALGLFTASPALADDCLLDTSGDGVATNGVDSDLGAGSNLDDSRVACGGTAKANTFGSTAVGTNSVAGDASVGSTTGASAFGYSATATGTNATAIGVFSNASRPGTVALGQ